MNKDKIVYNIESLSLTNFTPFKTLDVQCSRGINIFIGGLFLTVGHATSEN